MEPWTRKRTCPAPVDQQHKKMKSEQNQSILVTTLCKTPPSNFLQSFEQDDKREEPKETDKLKLLVQDLFDKSDYLTQSVDDSNGPTNNVLIDLSLSDEEKESAVVQSPRVTEQRQSVLISPQKLSKSKKTKIQCKYLYKKGTKKGMQCTLFSIHEMCSLHLNQKKDIEGFQSKKILKFKEENQLMGDKIRKLEKQINENPSQQDILELKNKNKELEEKVTQLEKNWEEVNSKFSQILEVLAKNEAIQRIETLIELVKETEAKTVSLTKINKLDTCKTYKLVKVLGENHAVISCDEKLIQVKFPKTMNCPQQIEGFFLQFNEEIKKFKWVINTE